MSESIPFTELSSDASSNDETKVVQEKRVSSSCSENNSVERKHEQKSDEVDFDENLSSQNGSENSLTTSNNQDMETSSSKPSIPLLFLPDDKEVPSCCGNSGQIATTEPLVRCVQCLQNQHISCAQIKDENNIPLNWKCADCSIVDIVHDLCENSDDRYSQTVDVSSPMCQIQLDSKEQSIDMEDENKSIDKTSHESVLDSNEIDAKNESTLANSEGNELSQDKSLEELKEKVNLQSEEYIKKADSFNEDSAVLSGDDLSKKLQQENSEMNQKNDVANNAEKDSGITEIKGFFKEPDADLESSCTLNEEDNLARKDDSILKSATDDDDTENTSTKDAEMSTEFRSTNGVSASEEKSPVSKGSTDWEPTEIDSIDLPISVNEHKLPILLPDPSEEPLKAPCSFEDKDKFTLRSSESFEKENKLSSISHEDCFLTDEVTSSAPKKDFFNPDCEFIAVRYGTVMGNPKLFDSLNYAYTYRKKYDKNKQPIASTADIWQCTQCNGHKKCRAVVIQESNSYTRRYSHNHSGGQDRISFEEAKELKVTENSPVFLDLNPKPMTNTTDSPIQLESSEESSPQLTAKKKRRTIDKANSSISSPTLKSAYVVVNSESSNPMLIDRVLGFTYRVSKLTERTKIWLCRKADDETIKCNAVVKEVGDCFVRSRDKHLHEADSAELEAFNNKVNVNAAPKNEETEPMVVKTEELLSNDCVDEDINVPESLVDCKDSFMTQKSSLKNKNKRNSSKTDNGSSGQCEYVTMKYATKRGNPKVFDSLGYVYDLRSVNNETIYWQCVCRMKDNCCRASLVQVGSEFTRRNVHSTHYCNTQEFLDLKAELLSNGTPSLLDAKYLASLDANRNKTRVNRVIGHGVAKIFSHKRKKKALKSKTEQAESISPKNKVKKVIPQAKSSFSPYFIYTLKSKEERLIDQRLFYTYKIHNSIGDMNEWICVKCDRTVQCKAIVKQNGDVFTSPAPDHSHVPSGAEKYTAMERSKEARLKPIVFVDVKKDETPIGNSSLSTPPTSSEAKKLTKEKPENYLQKVIILSSEERQAVTKALTTIQNAGICVDNSQYCREAIRYYLNKQDMNVFVGNVPSKVWLKSFIASNSTLDSLSADALLQERINHLFKTLESSLSINYRLDATKYLCEKKSNRIFACDTIECVINTSKVGPETDLSMRGQRTMMVMCSTSLAGHSIKPLIIHRRDREHKKRWKYDSHEDVDGKYNRIDSPEGNVTSEVFHSWLVNFDNELVEKEIPRPVIAFVSGCHEQVAFESIELANNRNIFLFCLPKKASHLLNPMSRTVFPDLKKKYMANFTDSLQNNTRAMPRRLFPIVFLKSYAETRVSDLITEGFKSTGLCPYNPSLVINELPNKLKPNNDSAPISGKRSRHEESSPVNHSKKVKREKSDSPGTNLNSSSSSAKKRKSTVMSTNSLTDVDVAAHDSETFDASCEFQNNRLVNQRELSDKNSSQVKSEISSLNIDQTNESSEKDEMTSKTKRSRRSSYKGNLKTVAITSSQKRKSERAEGMNPDDSKSSKHKTPVRKSENIKIVQKLEVKTDPTRKPRKSGRFKVNETSSSTDAQHTESDLVKDESVSLGGNQSMSSLNLNGTHDAEQTNEVTNKSLSDQHVSPSVGNRISATQEGYNLALGHFDKIFETVIDPQVLDLYRKKFNSHSEYPDTSFLIWRRLQKLKQISAGFSSNSIDITEDDNQSIEFPI